MNFSPALLTLAQNAEAKCTPQFAKADQIAEVNTFRVLAAFRQNNISESHLLGTTGYGYGDRGRDALDAVYAHVFGAEDALVRHNFVSGTHSLLTALFAVLRPGDVMLSVTGKPYDTLEEGIGIRGTNVGSLKEFGVGYRQIDLLADGAPDLPAIQAALQSDPHIKLVYLQRSRGYSLRPSLDIDAIGRVTAAAKAVSPHVVVMVDNCYGELVETREPCHVGVDLVAGSLIKNPGGGIAQTGGYIAGKKHLIEQCAFRLTCPGMGKEVGATLHELRPMYMGLFFAPTVVAAAVKTAVFAAALLEDMGLAVSPKWDAPRSDIIETIFLESDARMIAFCKGIQSGSPIDAHVSPEPWDMPGYDAPVIMAAGAFTMGASIELSADAPLRPPYAAWMQGGLTYPAGKYGVMCAAAAIASESHLS